MRYLYLLSTALIISGLFSACDKPNQEPDNAGFVVNGVADQNLKANKSVTIPLEVVLKAGEQETVNLSLTGLPDKVTHEFSAVSGTLDFATNLTILADYAANGTYPLVLTATGTSGASKPYNFNLVIEDYEECAASMAGVYSGSSACNSQPGGINSYAVTINPNVTNGIIIESTYYNNLHRNVLATLDCETNSILVPERTDISSSLDTFTVKGSGKFSPDGGISLTLEWIVRTPGGDFNKDETCSYTLAK